MIFYISHIYATHGSICNHMTSFSNFCEDYLTQQIFLNEKSATHSIEHGKIKDFFF